MGERWRQGRINPGRVIFVDRGPDYDGEPIGMMDTSELAAEVVQAVNNWRVIAEGHVVFADDLSEAALGERYTEPTPSAQFDAHGRLRWAPPTRFDPDDRNTWPEDGQRVLVSGNGWWGCTFLSDAVGNDYRRVPCWRHDGSDSDAWFDAEAGDLWLPLPPTPQEGS
jgi:hypothetical protein